MSVLSRNVKAAYPQKVFEVGRVYLRKGSNRTEESHLAALVAHSSSSFSEETNLEPLIEEKLGGRLRTPATVHWAFADGRCAEDLVDGRRLGYIGEVRPATVASFGLDVPVAGFEIDLAGFV